MKYKEGEFGYWWTVINGNKDIEGKVYAGSIFCRCSSLISLKGAPKEVGGGFDCSYSNLTSLKGAPEKVGGYFDCSGNALTSLKGAPEKVGGYFDCSGNALTTLEGAPEKVGGYFYCYNNALTTLKGAPEKVSGYFVCSGSPQLRELLDKMPTQAIRGDVYKWCGKLWSFFDGVQKEVATIRKSGSLTVYKMKDGTYAVHDGEAYAHGETLKEAKADLLYKRTSKDLSEYKELTLDSKLTLEECIKMYRSVTGACSLGTKEFCSRRKLKKAYTVGEVIELTDGAYGNERLKEFFKKANNHNR